MYPAQTSLIPIQIALVRFIEQGGNVFGSYPYWYLGTTPFRYLTGPILPSILVILNRFFPGLSLFEIFFGLISLIFPFGALGLYLLVKELKGSQQSAVLAGVFYFFGPIIPFLFRFSGGLYLMAFSFLPFILIIYLRLLKEWTTKRAILLFVSISIIILLDSLILPSLLLGMVIVFLVQVGWKKAEEKIKKTLFILVFSLLLVTFWYTPGYWLTLFSTPSLAGKGLMTVILWLGRLLPVVLALGMAVFSAKFFRKKSFLRDFCFYWLFIFICLTLLRFLSDPDFWLDWIVYGTELQFGLAIFGGYLLGNWAEQVGIRKIKAKVGIVLVTGMLLIIWLFVFNQTVLVAWQNDITQTVEYQIGSRLDKVAKSGEKVFLSGTTVFWLNAFFDISQVRGGVDQASVDSRWRKAAWEIREGEDPEKSLQWLRDLEINYLVVHTEESEEFYHDFSYPEKFEEISGLEKVYDQNGDKIYRLLD